MLGQPNSRRNWGRAEVAAALAIGSMAGLACNSDSGDPSVTTSGPVGSTSTTDVDTDTDTTGEDTFDTDSGTGGTAPPPLEVDCGMPPTGAVGAQYDHTPTATGAQGPITWAVTGLPVGMSFDPLSGDLGGAPDQEGSFPITLTATTSTQTGDAMCTIDVGPGLAVELPGGCIWPGDDLFDHVNGGDGADIECDTPEGSGEGRLPDGVTVDPTTCAIEGTSSDTYGTWVWITRLTQSGNQVHVPYCFTQDTQLPNAYAITGDHSGAIGNHLEPLVTTFAPGVAVAAGGGGDPYFEVRGPCGANSCYFGFTYAIGASQFGDCGQTDCYGLSPTAIIDPGPGPEGFSHELWALGDPVESGYEARPWVLSWDLHYCISDTEADCNGTAAIEANGDGELRFGMIMLPE